MEKARTIVGNITQKLMDLVLLLWTLLSEYQQRSAKMKAEAGGLEMGYEVLDTSSCSDSSFVTAYSEFEVECETPKDNNKPRIIELDNQAFVVYSDNDNKMTDNCYTDEVNNDIRENRSKYSYNENDTNDNTLNEQNKENNHVPYENVSELDSSFSFNCEEVEDFGYESDSESQGSNSVDSDEDSQTSDTYTAFDDVSDDDGDVSDDDDECAPPPPIRITPIERTMHVAEGLRIAVLKQEAWKALPYYHKQSPV